MSIEVEGLAPTPAAEPIAAPAPESTVIQDEPETPPEKTFTQAELDEIIEKRVARERRKLEKIERQRDVEAEVQRRMAEMQAQPKGEDGPPKREDFESLEDYLEAKSDWKVEQKLKERDAQDQQKQAQRTAEERQREQARSWEERAAKAAEKYPDFDEVVRNDDLAITDDMAAAIRRHELGVDVAYHLGKNPEEALRIARLDPYQQVFELGVIAASLKKAPEKPVSKAGAPLEAITTSGQGGRKSIYDPNLSVDEYVKLRNAGKH